MPKMSPSNVSILCVHREVITNWQTLCFQLWNAACKILTGYCRRGLYPRPRAFLLRYAWLRLCRSVAGGLHMLARWTAHTDKTRAHTCSGLIFIPHWRSDILSLFFSHRLQGRCDWGITGSQTPQTFAAKCRLFSSPSSRLPLLEYESLAGLG